MFELDRNQSDGVPGSTAYFVRLPGEVFTSRNDFNLVGVRHGRLYLLASGGTAEKRAAAYYGEASRIFVNDGSPINPAVFDLVLPPDAPASPKRPSRPGVWGSQEDWDWVRDQHLPRPLLREESALYSHVASTLDPYEASALLEQIRLSQIVYEDNGQTCFVVNRDAPKLSVAAPRLVCAQYHDDAADGVAINLTMVTSQDGRLLSATRQRSDGASLRYVIPPVDQVKLRET